MGRLIDSIGTANFDAEAFEAVNQLVPVEEISGFLLDQIATPHLFGVWGRRADCAQRARSYAAHHYSRDPLIREVRSQPRRTAGTMLVRSDKATRVEDADYRWECFDEPSFRSRFTMVRTNPSGWAMINFYLTDDAPGEATVKELIDFSLALFPIARRHFKLPDWGHEGGEAHSTDGVEKRLAQRFPALTARELSVCALTMSGRSSGQIAALLDIAPATVLTYRRRAYERLGISSAGELVQHLL